MSRALQERGQHRDSRQLLRDLPPDLIGRKAPARLLWLPAHLLFVAALVHVQLAPSLAWGWRLVVAALIGHSYGCLLFLAHEILHNTVVGNRRWQNWLGTLCLLPYCISASQWRICHNRFHHGFTNRSGLDPDTFGNVLLYRRSRLVRFAVSFAPGSGYRRSWLFMAFWFSSHALTVLFVHSRQYGYWSTARRRRQWLAFGGMVGFWAAALALVGPFYFLWIYWLPMVAANGLLMAYIATNHMLCDETDHHDPLASTLSVSVPKWIDWLHLNYSFHVEHHVCPAISPRYAAEVRKALVARYGDRCRRIPMWRALYLLYRTPRIHLGERELVDMHTGQVYGTLGPSGEDPVRTGQIAKVVRWRQRAAAESEPESMPATLPIDAPRLEEAAALKWAA